MSAPVLLFYALGALALFSALLMVVLPRNVVAGAMSLVVTMICLAGIFVLLGAEFLGAIQIILYAGAIMVLLLFVVMLLNLEGEVLGATTHARAAMKVLACVVVVGVAALLAYALPSGESAPDAALERVATMGGNRAVGRALFTEFVLPLEAAGLLLLAAIVGAVIVAKRRID